MYGRDPVSDRTIVFRLDIVKRIYMDKMGSSKGRSGMLDFSLACIIDREARPGRYTILTSRDGADQTKEVEVNGNKNRL